MQHRHLLPNELDLLVDGDAGFGTAPLRAHVAECAECRARVDELAAVVAELDGVPYFTPRREFADNVMNRVQVIEPWHVAAVEWGRRFVPASTPMRAVALSGVAATALLVSASGAWLAYRADLARWILDLALDRGRQTVAQGAGAVAADALGAAATSTSGFTLLALGGLVLAATATAAIAGFRRIAARAHARRA